MRTRKKTRTRKKKRAIVTTELPRGALGRGVFAGCASLLFLVPAAAVGPHTLQPASPVVQSASPTPKNDYALIYGTVWGPDQHPAAGITYTHLRAHETVLDLV